jgi:hypothetical protein
MGLDRKFFHVTISARDDHSLHKGIQSVIDRLGVDELVDRLENMSVDGMQEVFQSSRTAYSELEYGPPSFVSHFPSMAQNLLHPMPIIPSWYSIPSSLRESTTGLRGNSPQQWKVGLGPYLEC